MDPTPNELAEIKAQLTRIEVMVKRLVQPNRRPLTITEFSRLSGRSRMTVYKMIENRELRRVGGRIPFEVAEPYL
jgi:hypothetical protein